MKPFQTRILVAAPLLAVAAAVVPFAEGAEPPVAIVYALSGEAGVAVPPAQAHAVTLFERLAEGAVVEVGGTSSLAVVFASGARYELSGRARATLGRSDVTASTGAVRRLEPVPALPPVFRIAEDETVGERVGAIRLRRNRIRNLYPSAAAALADATLLRFEPVAPGLRYRVEVEQFDGRTVFAVETDSAAVAVPAGVLKPGQRYYWVVRTVDAAGWAVRGEAEFRTLDADAARAQGALREAVERGGDPAALALLGEVDRGLGLLAEARAALDAAVAGSPGDAALLAARESLDRQLHPPSEP